MNRRCSPGSPPAPLCRRLRRQVRRPRHRVSNKVDWLERPRKRLTVVSAAIKDLVTSMGGADGDDGGSRGNGSLDTRTVKRTKEAEEGQLSSFKRWREKKWKKRTESPRRSPSSHKGSRAPWRREGRGPGTAYLGGDGYLRR
jgi:hypothetical protein